MKARIHEVFESIQGEGYYLGEKQVFVRFFGCNLNCRFCDTKLDAFSEYDPRELFDEIMLYGSDHHSVSFTGGEPLLQAAFLRDILRLIQSEGVKNYLETNGTLVGELEAVIDLVDIVAMDVKLPSSTGMPHFWGLHRRFLKVASRKEVFLKAIISSGTSQEDLKEALSVIKDVNNAALLVLQPNAQERHLLQEKMENFKQICRDQGVSACVIPQMHKIIGVR